MEDMTRNQERIAQQVVATMIDSQISNGDVRIEEAHTDAKRMDLYNSLYK